MQVKTKNYGLITFEEPEPKVQYFAGIDPALSGAFGEDQFVLLITKKVGSNFIPVALYFERPERLELVYDKAVWLVKKYNKYGTWDTPAIRVCYLANAATADHIFQHFWRNDIEHFLVGRKSKISGKINPGIVHTQKIQENIEGIVNSFVEESWERLGLGDSGLRREDYKGAATAIFATIDLMLFGNGNSRI